MTSDLLILKALLTRKRWRSLSGAVPVETLSTTGRSLFQWINAYWNQAAETIEVLDCTALEAFIKLKANATPEQLALTAQILKQLNKPVQQEVMDSIIASLLERDFSGRAGALIARFNEGAEIDLVYELSNLSQAVKRQIGNSSVEDFIDTDIGILLSEQADDNGLKLPTMLLSTHIKGLLGGDLVAIAARPDKGKCLALGTLVRMHPEGVKKVEDVQVGDTLMGPDGLPRTVLGTTTGVDLMYEVRYPWGESYTVNSEHILSLKRSKADAKHPYGTVLNVPVHEYVKWTDSCKARYKGWKAGVEYSPKVQQMPPYLLGLWIGDGTATKPSITTVDQEILDAFTEEYGEYSRCWNGITYDFYRTRMLQDLRKYNLLGNKHIPEDYLLGSRQQRLELLAGIIDSDGHAGDVYEVVTKSEELGKQYVELVRSLGFHATIKATMKRTTNSTTQASLYWRVRIGAEAFGEVPVRLKRKLGNTRDRKRKGLQFGIEVIPKGVGEYAGFGLDGDHLFLLGDFTVTHNTSLLAAICTHLAPQIPKCFEPDRPILWLNNEGSGKQIVPRVYQAALKVDGDVLQQYNAEGTLVERYVKAVGHKHRIRVKDMHGASFAQIEQVIEAMNPCIVLFDMVANFRGGLGGGSSGGNKTDEIESKWQAMREMAVQHDFIAFGTIQVSADGDDMLYPPYGALKDSKTSVQGAVDILLMLGALNSPDMQSVRGLSTPKNKRQLPKMPSYVQGQVHFDAAKCQFLDGE